MTDDAVEAPAQFGLRGLLVLQAVFALFVAMLVATGIWALLPLFFGTMLLRWGPLRVKSPGPRRLVFDLLAGVVLPVLCLVYDPVVFHGHGIPIGFYSLVYVFVAFEIIALLAWKASYALTGRRSALLSGFLAAGAFLAGAVGWCMAFAMTALLWNSRGLSVLMMTPLLTMSALSNNSAAALGPRHDRQGICWFRVVRFWFGVGLAIGIPWLIAWGFGEGLNVLIRQFPFPEPPSFLQ
ncbi:MAG: hypothetical protein JW818_15285 [Pirellulales bacterium]|nr:hypothetical protein [Pirellulales bacterium]